MNDNGLTKEQLKTLNEFLGKLCGMDIDYLIAKNNININSEDLMPIVNKLMKIVEE
jgi:hypothetical protein